MDSSDSIPMNIFPNNNKNIKFLPPNIHKLKTTSFVAKSHEIVMDIIYATQQRICAIENRLSSFIANNKKIQ